MKRWRQLAIQLLFGALVLPTLSCASPSLPHAHRAASFVERQRPDVVRLLNWNVRSSSIIAPDGARHEAFMRIVKATAPDIICLQEIAPTHSPELLREMMLQALPGFDWEAHAVADNVVLSRFPLLRRDGAEVIANPAPRLGLDDFYLGHAGVLVDIPARIGERDLYVFAVHNKSRGGSDNMRKRQRHSDTIVRDLRALRQPGSDSALPPGTPIVIAGDLNVLTNEMDDPLQHLTTLLTGDIVDEDSFGPDLQLDWDNSPLTDLRV